MDSPHGVGQIGRMDRYFGNSGLLRLGLTMSILMLIAPFAGHRSGVQADRLPAGEPRPLPYTEEPAPLGATYFVSLSGSDSNPGTNAEPWRTIQRAADTLQPGDTVNVRAGIYNEAVVINVSGSSGGGAVTFKSYQGETAVVDGTGLTVPPVDTGLFFIEDQSYIVIRGFEIRNYKTSTAERLPVGINIRGSAHHIEVRDNRIHSIETNAPVDVNLLGADAHGIAVYGTKAPDSIHDIIIDGNEIHALKLGSSEAVALNGNVEGFTVSNNLIHDCDNIGLDLIGFEGTSPDSGLDQARDGTVSRNTIYNIDTSSNPAYGGGRSAGGIYVDGGTRIVIEENRVHECNIGIEIASEHQGRATSFITVRNNFVLNNHITGVALGGYDTERGSTTACVVVNNTLYNNDTMEDGNGEILLQYDTQYNVLKNNILHANNTQSLLIANAYTQNTNNTVDYNIYYAPEGAQYSQWQWKGVTYTGFAAYIAGTGNDQNSLFIDCLLEAPQSRNLHLQETSPAIDIGANLTESGERDIDGQARKQGGGIDIGADEFMTSSILSHLPMVLQGS